MEMWQVALVNKWNRLNNPEVMGYEVARKAGEIADFFGNIEWKSYDNYSTNDFTSYVESLIRGYLFNTQEYEEMNVTTTLDLHNVSCTGYGLHDLDHYLSEMWNEYFWFAIKQGI